MQENRSPPNCLHSSTHSACQDVWTSICKLKQECKAQQTESWPAADLLSLKKASMEILSRLRGLFGELPMPSPVGIARTACVPGIAAADSEPLIRVSTLLSVRAAASTSCAPPFGRGKACTTARTAAKVSAMV
eukprot:3423879-Pleurochrysis_carterae.AAC.3